jgi:hypothetical protein
MQLPEIREVCKFTIPAFTIPTASFSVPSQFRPIRVEVSESCSLQIRAAKAS